MTDELQEIPFQPSSDNTANEVASESRCENDRSVTDAGNEKDCTCSLENKPAFDSQILNHDTDIGIDKLSKFVPVVTHGQKFRTKRKHFKEACGQDISDVDSGTQELYGFNCDKTETKEYLENGGSKRRRLQQKDESHSEIDGTKHIQADDLSLYPSGFDSLDNTINRLDGTSRCVERTVTYIDKNEDCCSKLVESYSDSGNSLSIPGGCDNSGEFTVHNNTIDDHSQLSFLNTYSSSPDIPPETLDLDNEFTLRSQREKYDALEQNYNCNNKGSYDITFELDSDTGPDSFPENTYS